MFICLFVVFSMFFFSESSVESLFCTGLFSECSFVFLNCVIFNMVCYENTINCVIFLNCVILCSKCFF